MADLPRPLLVSIYESIKKEQFKIPEDDGNDLVHTFFNPGTRVFRVDASLFLWEVTLKEYLCRFDHIFYPLYLSLNMAYPISFHFQTKKAGYGNRERIDIGTGRGDGLF